MNNYLLSIQYDGTNYSGWQNQNNSRTIQNEIEKNISIILKRKIKIIGAGRTDAGVHALDQKANFKVEQEIDLYKFQYSLNSILPADISIRSIIKVSEGFNARFDARNRTYIYLINRFKSPFYKNYSFFYPYQLDINKLNFLSELLLGENDFSSFSKKNNEANKVCNVYFAKWYKKNDFILFKITANRFLRGMVRSIVGTLLKLEKNCSPKDKLIEIIEAKNRSFADENVPAKGLFLYKVEY